MASKFGSVWAVDVGSSSLKALRLSLLGDVVTVTGFDNVQHGKILTGEGVTATEREELVALSLRRFVSQNGLGKDLVVISVPSQNSFARFVNLPPVELKRIPEIVKFEAAQQIPFDINEVQWDWQLMSEVHGSENRVGIFAIKTEVVTSVLEHFSRENLRVSYVQMAPMALYNYVLYDRPEMAKSEGQSVVVLSIGAETTDLVVCTKSTVWQRSIAMAGNSFTRAISDAFKLSFEKAEKLKRTALVSKYARQVFQAMKPVFTDLASEIQRSLGFYISSNPNARVAKILALGGGTEMHGLLKYIQQTLQVPVEKPDSFKRLVISPDISAAKFHENVRDFGIVYGLALQGLGLAKIESNLLPRHIARSMVWVSKAKYFTIAACMLLAVSIMSMARTYLDRLSYYSEDREADRRQVAAVISSAKDAAGLLDEQKGRASVSEAIVKKAVDVFNYRNVVPLLHEVIISALPSASNDKDQVELYNAFANRDVDAVLRIPRSQRRQLFVTGMSIYFTDDLDSAKFSSLDVYKRTWEGARPGSMAFPETSEIRLEAPMLSMPTYGPRTSVFRGRGGTLTSKGSQGNAGFVVSVAGYSPYKNISELLDPVGVEGNAERWGFVTRLLHLDQVVDGNSPFELYKKTEVEHFDLKVGQVSADAEMPAGIGVEDVRVITRKESARGSDRKEEVTILVDPMTKEVISREPLLDEDGREKLDSNGKVIYQLNDHWFVLNCKFLWRDAPKQVELPGFEASVGKSLAPEGTSRKGSSKSTSSSKTRRTTVEGEDF